MTEPYTSYEAKLLDAVERMLADSATFRTVVGATTTETALARIVEYHGGEAAIVGKGRAIAATGAPFECASTTYGVVVALEFADSDVEAQRYEARSGEATWLLNLLPPSTVAPTERLRWALNQAGSIRADLKAMLMTPGRLAAASIGLKLEPIPTSDGAQIARVHAILTASWRNA